MLAIPTHNERKLDVCIISNFVLIITTRVNIFSLYFRLHVMGGGDQWPIKHIVIHVSMDVFPLLYLFLSDGIFTDGWWWWIVSTIISITCDYIDDLLRWRLYIYIVIKVDWKSSPSKLNRYYISQLSLSTPPLCELLAVDCAFVRCRGEGDACRLLFAGKTAVTLPSQSHRVFHLLVVGIDYKPWIILYISKWKWRVPV